MRDRKRRRILPHATPEGEDAADLEVRHHVEERIDRLVSEGWDREEAEAEAWRRFGDLEDIKREMWDSGAGAPAWSRSRRGLGELLGELGRDTRTAARTLLRRPVFTGAAVLTLAIAIGANATIFSVVDATLLRPLPYPHADRLMRAFILVPDLGEGEGAMREISWSYPKYELLRERQNVFEALSIFRTNWFAITGDAGARHVDGEIVSQDYLPMLGVEPILGRNFLSEENATPGTHYVALLSHDLWSRRFGRDPGILGTEIRLEDQLMGGGPRSYRVVGVLPSGFRGLTGGADVWVPIMTRPEGQLANPATHNKWVLARLREGITPDEARVAMATLGREIHEIHPGWGERADEWTAGAVRLEEERMDPTIRRAVLLTFGAVGCLLLIACVNVANLLLARASTQRREIALRKAMGAGRGRIVRYLLTESGLIALTGAVAGLLMAYGGVAAIRKLVPVAVGAATEGFFRGALGGLTDQGLSSIRFDGSVTLFGVLVALLSVFVFGLVPALFTARGDLTAMLRHGGRGAVASGSARGLLSQRALVAIEVAFTFGLLVASGLMLRSVDRLLTQDKGFETEGTVSGELFLSWDYDWPGAAAFYSSLDERLEALPGADAVGRGSCIPLASSFGCGTASGGATATILGAGERGAAEVALGVESSTAGFFTALRIPLLEGRGFTDEDRPEGPKVALVSESAARRYWPARSPLGAQVVVGDDTVEVVGVVADVRYESLAREPDPLLYRPSSQVASRGSYVVLRTRGDPGSVVSGLRATVAELDPDVPVMNVGILSERVADVSSTTRFAASLLTMFGVVGLLLAAVGVYGVVAFGVARQKHDIGVHMAIGARRADVAMSVLARGGRMTAAGIAVGLVLVFGSRRALGSVVYGVEPLDSLTLAGTAALLAVIAVLASWIPARRAMAVDPVTALRAD